MAEVSCRKPVVGRFKRVSVVIEFSAIKYTEMFV